MENLKKLLLSSLLAGFVAAAGWCSQMTGGDYVITKDLTGATGNSSVASTDYSLSFAWGEPVSGDVISEQTYTITSGYYGGRFGNGQTFQLLSSQVGVTGTKTFFQGQLQVGVPFDAPVMVTFSDQLDDTSLVSGVQVVLSVDHLGNSLGANVPFTVTSDPVNHTITLQPQGAWSGNTLYDVQVTPQLLSVDEFPLDQVYHIYFVTMLDLHQENVVLNPLVAGIAGDGSAGPLSIDIPTDSLSNYSAVLLSRDPLNKPLSVDPKIIQDADDKARAAGGPYQVPVSIQEVDAYDANGNLMGPLSKPAEITIDYGAGFGAGVSLIRPQTLSLWTLDEEHRLWVKIPASQNASVSHTVTAPVAYFSVFALMGSSAGSATDSFVFPVPWRPHGPNAGTGPGQTGSEADGITFSNIPSECTIKIYTITGDLVREIQHSDTGGLIAQEKWDVKTTHGDTVASGVYLWRVESSVDGKNGKLMVIR